MLKCLLDTMENYEESAEEKTEELHDKLHDKLHDMFPEISGKAFGVLEVLKAHPGLKAEAIGAEVSLSERQVKTYLNALKQAGLIVRVGSNKTGYWKVTIEE
jgi:predicted HTH transcriptional regulator